MAVQEFVAVPPITAVHLADDGTFPNSRFPVLIYHAAIDRQSADADSLEELFRDHEWLPAWRWSIYPFHHYHSSAHEVLGIARGTARVMIGGPKGREFDLAPGDVVAIPAGVAHRLLHASSDFLVVGAYPPDQDWDLLRGEPGERPQADEMIARVPLPQSDPVHGRQGPLIDLWAVRR